MTTISTNYDSNVQTLSRMYIGKDRERPNKIIKESEIKFTVYSS